MQTHVTQNQLAELLESEAAKAMLETGEERGWIEPAELEAFALEHELADPDVEDLTRELERIGLEVREARPEEKAEEVVYEADQPSGARRQPAALPGRRRPSQAADRGAGGHPREEDRARRPGREAADDRVEPAPRRLDREALPRARRPLPRSDPGRRRSA